MPEETKVPDDSLWPEERDWKREEWVRWRDDEKLDRSIDESPGGLYGDEGGGQKPENKED